MRVFCLLFGFNLLLLAIFLEKAYNINAANQSGGVYIVYMGTARKDHDQVVRRLLMKRKKTSPVHTYGRSFSGFSAHLSDEEAESMARQPEVVSVFRDWASKLHTTHSWDFLMSQNAYSSSKYHHHSNSTMSSHDQSVSCSIGADTIIGIIDSGFWPGHPSFDDKSMGPIPTRWKGECAPGNSSIPFECNKKLIGARCYTDVTACRWGLDVHGTHVASIAAGNLVWGASYKGLAEGIARGGSPCSRFATYNVCDDDGCWHSYILKAYDDAIADGVDVISVSLGGKNDDFFDDAFAIGSFHAVEKGITVVCSAGNGGPSPGSVENYAPWILSVGATTTDRVFEISIVLGDGNMRANIKGSGIYFEGLNNTAVYHLIDGRSASSNQTTDVADAINCVPGSLDDAKVKGKFILCDSYKDHYVDHMATKLEEQGAVGIIHINNFYHQDAHDLSSFIPFAAVNREDGAKINSYISSTRNPLVTMLPTIVRLNNKPAPTVSYISSRGPPPNDMMWNHLIKPDVVAPGVNIIAGVPPVVEEDGRIFQMYSGTSASCPHVSGLAAMLKSRYPTWSPSAIRSAIMTTATHTNNQHSPITTQNGSIATPHDIGSGEIYPCGSLLPGLVYETSTADYIHFLCNIGYNASAIRIMSSMVPNDFSCPSNSNPDLISDMNYPSIAVSGLTSNGSCRTVKRTVTNVGEACSTYTANVVAPTNVLQVHVVPKILRFTKNIKTLTFHVSFKLTTTFHDDLFGSITWCNQMYKVRSPFFVSNS